MKRSETEALLWKGEVDWIELSHNRVCVFIPRVGGHFLCRELSSLREEEGEATLEKIIGRRRVVVRAVRRGRKIKFEVRDYAPGYDLQLKGMRLKVIQGTLDTLEVKLLEEDKGIWRLVLPRWYENIPVEVFAEEHGNFALIRMTGEGANLKLSGCFLVFPDGEKFKVVKASICRSCFKPMVRSELLRELPPDLTGINVAFDAMGCLVCKLEGKDAERGAE